MKYRIDVNEGLAPEYVLVAIDEDYDVNPGKEQPLFVCNNWKIIEIIKSDMESEEGRFEKIAKASFIGNLASLYRGEYFGTVKQTVEKELAIINRQLPLDKKVWLKVAEGVNVIDEQELLDEQLGSTSKYKN